MDFRSNALAGIQRTFVPTPSADRRRSFVLPKGWILTSPLTDSLGQPKVRLFNSRVKCRWNKVENWLCRMTAKGFLRSPRECEKARSRGWEGVAEDRGNSWSPSEIPLDCNKTTSAAYLGTPRRNIPWIIICHGMNKSEWSGREHMLVIKVCGTKCLPVKVSRPQYRGY